MSPQIRMALRGLIGRALTAEEEAAIDPLLPQRDDVAIAAVLSQGRMRRTAREIDNGTVLEVLGLAAGNALLDEINSNAEYRHVKPLLEQGRLSIGSPLVQDELQSFVPAILTQAQADALCALGVEPDPIHYNTVSDALNIAEGRMTL